MHRLSDVDLNIEKFHNFVKLSTLCKLINMFFFRKNSCTVKVLAMAVSMLIIVAAIACIINFNWKLHQSNSTRFETMEYCNSNLMLTFIICTN